MKTNKPSDQKVVAVTYGRWSFMRGSDYGHLTGKCWVLLIGGQLWEVYHWSLARGGHPWRHQLSYGIQFCYSP